VSDQTRLVSDKTLRQIQDMGFGRRGSFIPICVLFFSGLALFAQENASHSHGGDEPSVHDAIETGADFHHLQSLLLSRNLCEGLPSGSDSIGLGAAACDLAREPALPSPAPTTLPTLIRDSRREDLEAFCSNPRVARVAERFREGTTGDRALSRAARDEFAEAEAESILDIIDDPYFSVARDHFYRSSGIDMLEGFIESICRGISTPLMPSDLSIARSTPEVDQEIHRRCGDSLSVVLSRSTPCGLTIGPCLLGGVVAISHAHICAVRVSPDPADEERCRERMRVLDEQERTRVAEENRRAQAACEARLAERIASCESERAAEESARSAAYSTCARGVRAEFAARAEEERARAAEARERRAEEDYVRCRERSISERLRTVCGFAGDSGSADGRLATALHGENACSSLGPNTSPGVRAGVGVAASRDPQDEARRLMDQVNGMRNAYDHVFPEPKVETCISRYGREARGVCESLERARQRSQNQLNEIYSPERLARAGARLNELKEHFRGMINSQRNLTPENRQRLLDRLERVTIGAPAGAEALAGVIRGGATYHCGFDALPRGLVPSSSTVRECSSSSILMPPDMLMRFVDGSDIDSGPVESILFHEMGHALTLPGPSSLFDNVNRCLSRVSEVSGFTAGTQNTVRMEALADWFGAGAMGAQLRSASESVRTEMLENRLGGEVCGLLHNPGGSCLSDQSRYFYPNELLGNSNTSSECRDILQEYDHPLTPDRLQILLSNGGVKAALGCSTTSLRETRGCSL